MRAKSGTHIQNTPYLGCSSITGHCAALTTPNLLNITPSLLWVIKEVCVKINQIQTVRKKQNTNTECHHRCEWGRILGWCKVFLQNHGSCSPSSLIVKFKNNRVFWLRKGQWAAGVTSVVVVFIGKLGSGVCCFHQGNVQPLRERLFFACGNGSIYLTA